MFAKKSYEGLFLPSLFCLTTTSCDYDKDVKPPSFLNFTFVIFIVSLMLGAILNLNLVNTRMLAVGGHGLALVI